MYTLFDIVTNCACQVLSAKERENHKTSLYRAPTSEELGELRENEDLYKSNLFRMQVSKKYDCFSLKKRERLDKLRMQIVPGAQPSALHYMNGLKYISLGFFTQKSFLKKLFL